MKNRLLRIATATLSFLSILPAMGVNERRYFSEGEMRDTLILTGSDNTDMTMYSAVEIRGSVPNSKEQDKPWHEGFGIRFAERGDSYIQAMLYPANTDYGHISDQCGMQLKIWRHNALGDSLIHTETHTDAMDCGRKQNTLSVESYRNGKVKIFAGNRTLEQLYTFSYPQPTIGERHAVIDGTVKVHLLVDEYRPDAAAMLQTHWTASSLQEYFLVHGAELKPLEGYWQYLDQDTDERYAHSGGRYRVALVANYDGGYNIIYVSGASITPHMWQTGMLKGQLSSTIFQGNYDLIWYDSEMQKVNHEAYASEEQDGMILSISFPTLKSTMRLFRVPWDR